MLFLSGGLEKGQIRVNDAEADLNEAPIGSNLQRLMRTPLNPRPHPPGPKVSLPLSVQFSSPVVYVLKSYELGG